MSSTTSMFDEVVEPKPEERNVVYVYTEGACATNDGPGGYAAIIRINGVQCQAGQGFPVTNQNQMDLLAVVVALETLRDIPQYKALPMVIRTTSRYVLNPIQMDWITSWRKNQWRKKDKKPVPNMMIWQRLAAVREILNVSFEHVKGAEEKLYTIPCRELAEDFAKQVVEGAQ